MINKSIFAVAILATSLVISSCKKDEDDNPDTSSQNTAPVAADDSRTVFTDGTNTFTVIDNDSDADGDSIFVSAIGTPSNGTAEITEDGKISYTVYGYTGTVTFDYTLSDGTATSTATITLTVQSAPVVEVSPIRVKMLTKIEDALTDKISNQFII